MDTFDKVTVYVSTAKASLAALENIVLQGESLKYKYIIDTAIKELKEVLKDVK